MVLIARTCERLIGFISSRGLQKQLLLIVGVALASAFVPLFAGGLQLGSGWTRIDRVFALLWIVGGACAIGAAAQAKFHRLAALIMVGVAGLATCLTFAWFSAPDLALTQIAVEVVTTVLLLLGLRWLPRRLKYDDLHRNSFRARARRVRDAIVAVAAGAGVAALAFAIMLRPPAEVLKAFFLELPTKDLACFQGFTQGENTAYVEVEPAFYDTIVAARKSVIGD